VLKRVFINNKKVPIPVPVQTLAEALAWVESTLVPPGHSITRVTLDDKVLGDAHEAATLLGAESKLEVQIDSPADLTLQTLDAMRNLATLVLGGLKQLAVDCWQARPTVKPLELDPLSNDTTLVLELIDHVAGLVDESTEEAAAILGLGAMLKRHQMALEMAQSNSDWKACARILLNKLEPLMKDLIAEAEGMQFRVMSAMGTGTFGVPPRGKQKAPTG